MQLYPHQEEAVKRLHNGCILWGGVGTGKSLAAAAYYFRNEAPKDIYVITTAKKRDSGDWQDEFRRFSEGLGAAASGAGILTVDSWNNIGKYRDIHGSFFIFDEQRLVGSGEWVAKFLAIAKRNRWILLSATPGDTWLDYIPVFCANGFFKNRTEFKRTHVVYKSWSKFPKVERYTSVGRLVRLRNEILVEMPFVRRTVRQEIEVEVDYDRLLFEKVVKKKWHIFEHRPLRDVAELFIVMRKLVNSDPSRMVHVRSLLTRHPRLIIFYNFDFELMALRGLIDPWPTLKPVSTTSSVHQDQVPASVAERSSLVLSPGQRITSTTSTTTSTCINRPNSSAWMTSSDTKSEDVSTIQETSRSFSVAEWNGHKHEPIPSGYSWVYLVQYAAGAEGWNCVETDAMVFYSLPYSYKLWEQARGRIDRLNTPFKNLFYYSLVSGSAIDVSIKKCLARKRSFNESQQTWAK